MDHLWVLGPEMNSTIPSNMTLLHTLIKSALTVTLMLIQHFLTATTIAATTMKITKNSVVASTLTLSLLQIYAAHAMEVILWLREKLELTVLNGTNPPLDMLQIVKKDLSAPIQSNTWTISHKSIRHASNLKVNGQLKINLDTGIIAARVMMIMMATGSVQIRNNPECGTTLSDPTLMESGLTTTVMQTVHGLQA
jgi:hypothetical protein